MSAPAPIAYEFAEWRVDTVRRLLLRHDAPVPLSGRALDTLLVLLRHHGRIVAKDDLMQEVWPNTFVEENNLTQCISALRRVLGERPGDHRYIVTAAGRGYQFAADVRVVAPADGAIVDAAPGPGAHVPEGAGREAPAPVLVGEGVGRTRWRIALAIALLVIGGVATALVWRAPEAGPPRRIAVLPFKPLVREADDQTLQLGMAETLIGTLGALEDITVRPFSAVRHYGSVDQDPLAAGRALGVDAVLDGQVQRWGDRIRVTTRLLRVADEKQLWAGQFDEAFEDIFSVQASIAEQVTRGLALTLTPGERSMLARRQTSDPVAYQLYVRARVLAAQSSRASMERAIVFLDQAIERDPAYALAYATLAECYLRLPVTSDVRPREALPRAKQAAARARDLDPQSADAHATLAWIALWFDWDWQASEQLFRRTLALDKRHAYARMGYSHLLSDLSRHGEAMRESDAALSADPASPLAMTIQAHVLYQARRYDEAARAVRQALELAPEFWVGWITLGKIELARGHQAAALEAITRADHASGGSSEPLSLLAYAHAIGGQRETAVRLLRELEGRRQSRYVPASYIAAGHAGLGDTAAAVRWLELAYDERDVHMVFLGADPKWDALRQDAGFSRIVERLGLPGAVESATGATR